VVSRAYAFLLTAGLVAACGLDITGSPLSVDASTEPQAVDDASLPDASPVDDDVVVDGGDTGGDVVVDAPDLPTLSLKTTTPPADLDLDVEGTAGWAHWGLDEDKNAFNRRDGFLDAISNFQLSVAAGGTNLRTFKDNRTNIVWAHGTPTESTDGTRHGVYSKDNQPTFTLRATVKPTTTELALYGGLHRAKARLVATLGDEVDAPTQSADYDFEPDNADYRFALAHHVTKETVLTITWTLLSKYDNNNSNVTLVAATLR
jgi:hypothetical protein